MLSPARPCPRPCGQLGLTWVDLLLTHPVFPLRALRGPGCEVGASGGTNHTQRKRYFCSKSLGGEERGRFFPLTFPVSAELLVDSPCLLWAGLDLALGLHWRSLALVDARCNRLRLPWNGRLSFLVSPTHPTSTQRTFYLLKLLLTGARLPFDGG